MAKKCMIARDKKRIKKVQLGRAVRDELRQIISSIASSYDEKMAAVVKLNKRDRNESPSRVQRRCERCGRPHAVYRKFGLCRICLRAAAMWGHATGLRKSSW